ncbi:hypothetical protein J7E94_32320 [Streptomyces sp. ISL-94]|nr:hypothetical protein [Streptomyces sp. ISL-94]
MNTPHALHPLHCPGRIPLILLTVLLALAGTALFAPTAAGGEAGGGGAGSFPITFRNDTRGAYADAQIFVTLLGQVTPGQWSYMKPDGTMAPISHQDATAPGHLTKNGVDYPDMSFTAARIGGTVPSPTSIRGGRIYVSLGSPVYIPVSPDDRGWGAPDPRNPNDPNADVYYDWYEYTYVHGQVAFGGNTTQVDQFGFPMTSRLRQTSSGYASWPARARWPRATTPRSSSARSSAPRSAAAWPSTPPPGTARRRTTPARQGTTTPASSTPSA